MSVLLQISDSHFGTEQAPVVEALVALSLQQRPDLLVLSGDITQRARHSQFRTARAFVDRLGTPVLALPGNHDIPLFDLGARLFHPYSHAFIEAGLVGERIYIEAGARGLGVCAVGAFYDAEAAALVAIDPEREWVVHFAALGVPSA